MSRRLLVSCHPEPRRRRGIPCRLRFLTLLIAAAPRLALDVPPKPTRWVNDYGANLLTPSETQRLETQLEQTCRRTGAQFLVMIWPSLEGDGHREFTNPGANRWQGK